MKNIFISLGLLISFNAIAEIGVTEEFIKRFSSLPSYTGVDISPDGKMISVITKMPDDKRGLTIFDAEDLSLINTITLSNEEEIAGYSGLTTNALLLESVTTIKNGVEVLAVNILVLTLTLQSLRIFLEEGAELALKKQRAKL